MNIQNLSYIKSQIDSVKQICVFGLGSLIHESFNQILLAIGRKPDFFCDNSKDKWGKSFWGIKCLSPNELAGYANNVFVIIAVKKYEQVNVQLNELGILNTAFVCFDRGYHSIIDIKSLEKNVSKSNVSKLDLNSKWTLITGASRGLGKLIAVNMAKLGSNIIVHSRSKKHCNQVIEECLRCNVEVKNVEAELSELDQVNKMLYEIDSFDHNVDIIFNNAAVSIPCRTEHWSVPMEDYLKSFTINSLGPITINNHFIPKMIRQGFGRVINISSSIQKRPLEMTYSVSKAALDKYVFDLAPSLQNTGVMISLADPGWLQTDMGGKIAPLSVDTAIPGVLIGAVLSEDINGRWITVQDYTDLNLEEAMVKAKLILENKLEFLEKPYELPAK